MIAGLDIGTTGSKIVVYDNDGNFIERFYKSYKTDRADGVSEIDSLALISTVKEIIKEALTKYKIDSIGVDSFGEAYVMLDENDNQLRNIILFTDHRGVEEAKMLENKLGASRIQEITGVSANNMFSLPKIMWVKNNEPEVFNKCKRILLIEDFVIYMLTGNAYIDYSLATRTMAFDINKLEFSDEILNAAGIDKSLFSKPVPTCFNCGTLRKEFAKECGISHDVVIATAGHDQIAVAIGSGVFSPGTAVDGAGTVECITPVFTSDANLKGLIEKSYAIVPYFNKNEFVTYAFQTTSGSLIDWFVDTFSKELGKQTFATLEKEFKEGPTGILVLPHFSGTGTPYMDNNSKGAIVGLTLEHSLANIYQAFLEGIAYEMRINVEEVNKNGIKIDRLVATGGGAASRKWLQIKSDILNLPIDILSNNESGSRGAAMASGVASKQFKSVNEAATIFVKKIDQVVPNEVNHKKYLEVFNKYKKLYNAVKGVINE